MPDPLSDERVPLGRWISLAERLPPEGWMLGGERAVLLFRPPLFGVGPGRLEVWVTRLARERGVARGFTHWLAIPWPLPRVGSSGVPPDPSPDEFLGASPSPTQSSIPSSSPAPSPLFPSWGSPPVCPADPPAISAPWFPTLGLGLIPLPDPAEFVRAHSVVCSPPED